MKTRIGFVSNSSTTSFIVIGVMVDKNKLYVTKAERNCDCEVDGIENMKFCSECGATVMGKVKVNIPEIEDYKIEEFPIHEFNDHSIISIPETYKKGYEDDINFVKIPENWNELKEKMKETLEPLGLWDDKEFGVWSGVEGEY